MTIETRPLGRTGDKVSVLGYGAMELWGPPRRPVIEDGEVGRLLNTVLDVGINLIDTSIDYGRSEVLIGRHLAQRRAEYFLASKCGCPLVLPLDTAPPFPHDYHASNIRAGVEQSLRRLRSDHLDLLQVHMSPSRAQLEADETVETLSSLRREGKVRFLGMSGVRPHLADHIDMRVFDVFQIPYSAMQREHEHLITAAAETGAGTMVRGGTARAASAENEQLHLSTSGLPGAEGRRQGSSPVEDLVANMSRRELLLRFTLSHPALSCMIVGTSSIDHLRSNLTFAERGPLPLDLYEELRQSLSPENC